MEILIVENAPGFGGSLTGVLHFVDAFPTYIHPTLICPFDPREFCDVPTRLRIEVVPRKLAEPVQRPGQSMPVTLAKYFARNVWAWSSQITKIARKYGADLIHANNQALSNTGAALAGRRLGIPVLSHQKAYEYPGRMMTEIIRRKVYSHHIATSYSIADHLLELGLEPERCSMIYDSIVPPDPMPSRERHEGPPVVAMHSVLRPSKGQDVFLQAVAPILLDNPDAMRVQIAGAPPVDSDYPQRLRQLAERLRIADQVEFLGHVRNPFQFLSGVDISVHASVEPEPFGRVAAESMLMEVPLVVTSGSGPAEYTLAAGAGITTPPSNVEALTKAIRDLLADPAGRQSMAEAGRRYALDEFAPDKIARQLVSLYEAVIHGRPPKETLVERPSRLETLEAAR